VKIQAEKRDHLLLTEASHHSCSSIILVTVSSPCQCLLDICRSLLQTTALSLPTFLRSLWSKILSYLLLVIRPWHQRQVISALHSTLWDLILCSQSHQGPYTRNRRYEECRISSRVGPRSWTPEAAKISSLHHVRPKHLTANHSTLSRHSWCTIYRQSLQTSVVTYGKLSVLRGFSVKVPLYSRNWWRILFGRYLSCGMFVGCGGVIRFVRSMRVYMRMTWLVIVRLLLGVNGVLECWWLGLTHGTSIDRWERMLANRWCRAPTFTLMTYASEWQRMPVAAAGHRCKAQYLIYSTHLKVRDHTIWKRWL